MGVSKMDEFEISPAKPKDLNPINELDITVELLVRDDSISADTTGALQLQEEEINNALRLLMKGKFANVNENIPL